MQRLKATQRHKSHNQYLRLSQQNSLFQFSFISRKCTTCLILSTNSLVQRVPVYYFYRWKPLTREPPDSKINYLIFTRYFIASQLFDGTCRVVKILMGTQLPSLPVDALSMGKNMTKVICFDRNVEETDFHEKVVFKSHAVDIKR